MEAEHNGVFSMGSSVPDGTNLVDKSVINSIVNRLDSLEKKEKESSINQQTNKLESEIRDIKDLLMSQMVKYEKFTLETNKRFEEVDEAFVELEKEQESSNSCDTQTEDIVNNDTTSDTTIVSNNLKNAIEQELSNSV